MTRPNRPCLGVQDRPCNQLTRNPGGRCRPCEQEFQRLRNQRVGYRRTYAYQQLAKATIQAMPVCIDCGSTVDLTADHVIPRSLEGGLVTRCRSCNGRKGDRPA